VIASRGRERGLAAVDHVRALHGEAEFVHANVAQARDVEELVQRVIARFDRLDVAVNNAGAIEVGVFRPLTEFDEADFDQQIAANLESVWLCMKHEVKQMMG
jgi:NAD(P)-dependent dehydrogenase (short-subunit alcohol dehydrogenase family)